MTKPRTTYSDPMIPVYWLDELGQIIRDETGDGIITSEYSSRVPTSYTGRTKSDTSYAPNTSVGSAWFLNSTFLTLASTTYRLNGYLTAIAPNQLSNKIPTSYA